MHIPIKILNNVNINVGRTLIIAGREGRKVSKKFCGLLDIFRPTEDLCLNQLHFER